MINADMYMARTAHRAYLHPISEKGEKWLIDNLEVESKNFPVTIGLDYIDELIKEIEAQGLGVERR